MSLKSDILRCFFINRPDSPYFESDLFNSILNYLQTGTNKAKLKQVGKMFLLIAQPVKSMQELYRFLSQMHKEVLRKQFSMRSEILISKSLTSGAEKEYIDTVVLYRDAFLHAFDNTEQASG